MRKIPAALAMVLLVVLFATNVRRARKQSFTADEARTYVLYVDAPLRAVLVDFDANNHILNTLAERLTASVFGVSELTLRLPSLAGGGLYLAAVFFLCRRLFGDGPGLVLGVAVLALNPYVLDLLSAARGYGLAVGLLLWALEFVLRYLDAARPEQLWRASLALGLGAAANLTIVFPSIALVGAVSAVMARRRQWAVLVDRFLLPGLAVAFVFLAIPLSHARREHFYVGLQSLAETAEGVARSSFYHNSPNQPDPPEGAAPLRFWLFQSVNRGAPAALALCAALLAGLLWRRRAALAPEQRFFALCAVTLVGSIAVLVAAHRLAGVPYPVRRTGLYLYPLSGLTGLALTRLAGRHRWTRLTLLPAGVVFFSLAVVEYARQWNTRYYNEWFYDSRTRDMVAMIERRQAGRPASVSVTWPIQATVEFYKQVRRLDWLEVKPLQARKEPADYYILAFEEKAQADRLEVLYRDDFAGVVLARARPRSP